MIPVQLERRLSAGIDPAEVSDVLDVLVQAAGRGVLSFDLVDRVARQLEAVEEREERRLQQRIAS